MSKIFIHNIKKRNKMLSFFVFAALMVGFFCCPRALAQELTVSEAENNALNPASGALAGSVIRVGIYYADNALPTANLQNAVGSGFNFGYYDEDYEFVQIGRTAETAITMAKDKNFYLSGSEYNEYSGSTLLGAYHVQLPTYYNSFESAKNAADTYNNGFPAFVGGKYVIRLDSFSTIANAQNYAANYSGSTVVGSSSTCITVCRTGTNIILFEYDPGEAINFAVEPRAVGADKSQTWFKGNKYYGGFQYTRANGNDITVINFVDIDDYAEGVIAYEMSPSWSLEALKAQAICARSYALSCNNHKTFDVCTTTSCQVYKGVYTGSYADNVKRAVSETSGLCIYYDDEPIVAMFHSEDGGATESYINSFGSGTKDVPYLDAVIDPYEAKTDTANATWTYYLSASEISTILSDFGYSNSGIKDVEVTKCSTVGNVNELTFTTSNGNKIVLSGDDVRSVFEDYSSGRYFSRRYTVTAPGEAATGVNNGQLAVYINGTLAAADSYSVISGSGTDTVSGSVSIINGDKSISNIQAGAAASAGTVLSMDKFVFIGSGWGHNVGMSQFGAKAMAELGYTYDEIINFYYSGVEIY